MTGYTPAVDPSDPLKLAGPFDADLNNAVLAIATKLNIKVSVGAASDPSIFFEPIVADTAASIVADLRARYALNDKLSGNASAGFAFASHLIHELGRTSSGFLAAACILSEFVTIPVVVAASEAGDHPDLANLGDGDKESFARNLKDYRAACVLQVAEENQGIVRTLYDIDQETGLTEAVAVNLGLLWAKEGVERADRLYTPDEATAASVGANERPFSKALIGLSPRAVLSSILPSPLQRGGGRPEAAPAPEGKRSPASKPYTLN